MLDNAQQATERTCDCLFTHFHLDNFPDNTFLNWGWGGINIDFPESLTLLSGSNVWGHSKFFKHVAPALCLDSVLARILIISAACPGKVDRVYSCYQEWHIQQILKLLSSPQQPFVVLLTAGGAEQEETGCSGQCSTAQLFVSRCQPALSLHCSSGGMPLMGYLLLMSQHSRQPLEK